MFNKTVDPYSVYLLYKSSHMRLANDASRHQFLVQMVEARVSWLLCLCRLMYKIDIIIMHFAHLEKQADIIIMHFTHLVKKQVLIEFHDRSVSQA